MKLFDSHAHLTSDEIYPLIERVLEEAKQAGVVRIMNICTDAPTLRRGLELGSLVEGLYNAGATTPHDVEREGEETFSLFEEAALKGALQAIGETGLDYYYEHSDRKKQQEFFVRYLHLADRCHLPVVIHCRDAFDDLYAIAKREFKGRALLHCFTGSYEEARCAVDLGWKVSFSGIVTFKKSQPLRDVAQRLPLESLLIETDAPYLAPQSKRGQQNEPSFVVETCQCLANLKGISLEKMAEITFENANSFFSLPHA